MNIKLAYTDTNLQVLKNFTLQTTIDISYIAQELKIIIFTVFVPKSLNDFIYIHILNTKLKY